MWLMMRHLFSKYHNSDQHGNRYYETSFFKDAMGRPYRWVKYCAQREASTIPPLWHCWMHHTIKNISTQDSKLQAPYKPRLTKTSDVEKAHTEQWYTPWSPLDSKK